VPAPGIASRPPPWPPINRPPGPPLAHAPAASEPATTERSASGASKVAELTMSKVLAGGMAAATSAVFGSYFGAFGTVAGAAFGSVATTVTTTIYQRSIERTRQSVKTKVQQVTGRTGDTSPTDAAPAGTGNSPAGHPLPGIPAAGKARGGSLTAANRFDAETVRLDPPPRSRRRSAKFMIFGTVMIFAVGLALITGVEWAKGSPISGGTAGTSVGRVLEPHAAPPPRRDPVRKPSTITPSSEPESESDNPHDSRHRDDSTESEDESSSSEPSEDRHSHHDDLFGSESARPSESERSDPNSPGLLPRLDQRRSDGLLQPDDHGR
jgi:hypothetical protein